MVEALPASLRGARGACVVDCQPRRDHTAPGAAADPRRYQARHIAGMIMETSDPKPLQARATGKAPDSAVMPHELGGSIGSCTSSEVDAEHPSPTTVPLLSAELRPLKRAPTPWTGRGQTPLARLCLT